MERHTMTRREVEVVLGVSEGSVRRLERAGVLEIERDERGFKLYRPSQVERVAEILRTGEPIERICERSEEARQQGQQLADMEEGGEVAATVFQLLEDGLSPAQIVIEEELSPTIVGALVREYQDLASLDANRMTDYLDGMSSYVQVLAQRDIPDLSNRLRRVEAYLGLLG